MMELLNLLWGTGIRRTITAVCGTAAAMAGAVTTVPPAWHQMGLPEVATKAHVAQAIDDKLKPFVDDNKAIHTSQAETTQSVERLLRFQQRSYKSQLEDRLYQAEQDPAAAASPTVQQRIRDLKAQIEDVTKKIVERPGR